jgi:hypothetical protein
MNFPVNKLIKEGIMQHIRYALKKRRAYVLISVCTIFLITLSISFTANADADAFPWKLLKTAPDGNLYIAHEYASEEACRADGERAAREATAVNCRAMACTVPVWCVDKGAAVITAFPGTAAPLKLRCYPAYYGIAPGATRPAQHPEWCEYVKQ